VYWLFSSFRKAVRPTAVTRPTSVAYWASAAVTCAGVAPGIVEAVKAFCAGSPTTTPKVMVGTTTPCVKRQKLTCVKSPPKLIECVPFAQVTESLKLLTGELRRSVLLRAVALLMPAALMPRLKPP
jgi:hypothetical protein